MVSLNATDTLRAVVLACLSLIVILLIKNLRAKLTILIDNEAITEKNWITPCCLQSVLGPILLLALYALLARLIYQMMTPHILNIIDVMKYEIKVQQKRWHGPTPRFSQLMSDGSMALSNYQLELLSRQILNIDRSRRANHPAQPSVTVFMSDYVFRTTNTFPVYFAILSSFDTDVPSSSPSSTATVASCALIAA